MLDLLQVTVEAGGSPGAALGAVGARFTGPLAAEWRAAATAIALGMPHDEALATLARHLPSPRVRAFADAMRRARRRGLPLGEVLARQAVAARHEQQIRIRERAARAGPKIQLVVALILVPSMMLIVAAALIAELTAPGVGLTLTTDCPYPPRAITSDDLRLTRSAREARPCRSWGEDPGAARACRTAPLVALAGHIDRWRCA